MRFPSSGFIFAAFVFMDMSTPAQPSEPRPQPTGLRAPYITPLLLRFGQLIRPREIFRAPTREKMVALTFDDGPSARYMADVLDVLEHEKVKATFFLVGDRIAVHSDPGSARRRANVQRAAQDGHEIAFHGWKHQSVGKSNERAFTDDLERFRAELAELIPAPPQSRVRFFRPPFGHMSGYVHRVMKAGKMRVVEADVLPGDLYFFPSYYLEDEQRAVDRVRRSVRPGSVICLHIGEDLGRQDSVYDAVNAGRIVATLIPSLRNDGYRFARMSELAPP